MSTIEDLYHSKARRDDSDGFIKMRGVFKPSPLTDRTFDHVFVPDDTGLPTVVIPVFSEHGIEDIVAVGDDVWGAVTGAASNLGTGDRVHRTPADWLASDSGILPLSKALSF